MAILIDCQLNYIFNVYFLSRVIRCLSLCTIFAINQSIPQSIPILHYARSHESYWDQQDDIDRDEFLEILSRLSRTVMNRPEMEK